MIPTYISSVIDSARWRSRGDKCGVREINLATFEVIMLRHCHWRKALSKSKVLVCDSAALSQQSK